jgi:CDP-glycerol glycerophosphotransferase (TagB/SpsB family)
MKYKKNYYNTHNFESIANIYENKYFCCIENFNIGEKLEFGIKIYNTERSNYIRYKDMKFLFFNDNILNFKDLNHINDSKFEPLLINEKYNDEVNETLSLKKTYIISPICSSKTSLEVEYNNWNFINLYNHYFCFCKGEKCFSKLVIEKGQICKYKIYLSIIDKNRYLYNKTDYLLADFLFEKLSSDDAYPIFKEMIKRNISAHYMTQKKNIYKQYCGNNEHCQIIIKEIFINGDILEKYLELFLKLKATISGNGFLSIDYFIFHKIEYITSINLGHGVKFFKSFLYTENASPKQYDKLVLIPSKKIINVALRYGWKEENIIKICLPKWDKYDKIKNKEIEKSIFIFFTWRQLKKGKNISSEYINNIIKLINSDILNKKLIEKNITLYYCLHHKFSQYKNTIKINQLKLKYINNSQISETLMKSSLLITDFSSVYFDYIYKRKPIIIYIPDSEDLNIKDNYDINYINLINNMKNGKIYFENKKQIFKYFCLKIYFIRISNFI